jgi:FdhD protein
LFFDMKKLERNFYTTSSCGVCGKSSIEAVKTICRLDNVEKDNLKISSKIIYDLPAVLRNHQDVFDFTGGLHGCGLFGQYGNLLLSREDVGRHNALDKLIGACLDQSLFPLNNHILLLSGRASFELIQKAWMAGIKIVAAIGAPSSLALQMAEESGITLIGFLRNKSFNIYSGAERIMTTYENTNQRQFGSLPPVKI